MEADEYKTDKSIIAAAWVAGLAAPSLPHIAISRQKFPGKIGARRRDAAGGTQCVSNHRCLATRKALSVC
jgi:hypothetical protein